MGICVCDVVVVAAEKENLSVAHTRTYQGGMDRNHIEG
jgi:hypothetical protein